MGGFQRRQVKWLPRHVSLFEALHSPQVITTDSSYSGTVTISRLPQSQQKLNAETFLNSFNSRWLNIFFGATTATKEDKPSVFKKLRLIFTI